MADKRLIISIFDTEADAHAAAKALRDTRASADDPVAVLVLDDDGELKTHKTGTTSGGKGMAAGAVFGLLGPVGLGIGVLGGGLIGKLHHKNLGLDDESRDRIASALRGGKAAVGVLADPEDLVAIESLLVGRGGDTDAHELDEAALREATESA
jgi:hypothetical protein